MHSVSLAQRRIQYVTDWKYKACSTSKLLPVHIPMVYTDSIDIASW